MKIFLIDNLCCDCICGKGHTKTPTKETLPLREEFYIWCTLWIYMKYYFSDQLQESLPSCNLDTFSIQK